MNTPLGLTPGPQLQQTLAGISPLDSDYMDDTPAKENPAKDFNKLDLSQLQGFSFGTQWTQDKGSPSESRERTDRPRREGGGGGPDRRDRRSFRRPAGPEGDAPAGGGGAPGAGPAEAPRREYSGDRGPRREYQGPRREAGPGGERGGPRFGGGYGGRGEMQDRGPYDSPYFSVAFYPEDTSFNALAKTIRSSCRTIELFEIARTVIAKPDRFVVVLARKTSEAAESAEGAAARPAKQPIAMSVPDGIPFESEEAAIAHVLANHLGRFFDLAEVEIDPPKGNFQVINRCGVTGELLGPPNYHRYTQIVQQHYSAKIARMPFEAYRSRIETVRDPEVVAQWLEKMKKTTRYTWKQSAKQAAAAAPAVVATEPATPLTDAAVAEATAQQESTTPETAPALTFDALEDARSYLLTSAREKVVRTVETARFHGKLVETMPAGEIRRAVEGALERQRRFPLDTANALRGRLRREHFTIFKKGSKGVSYVCAVKRKFRVPGQVFSDSISTLITYIEAFPMIRASELPKRYLNIDLPVAPSAAAETAPSAPAPSAEASVETSAEPAKSDVLPSAEPALTLEQRARINRMQGDLRWLVAEGYVTEFIDGRLFAPPPMVEARKKEAESAEHDPENFPEAPPAEATPAAPATEGAGRADAPATDSQSETSLPEAVQAEEARVAAPEPLPESVLTEPAQPETPPPERAPDSPEQKPGETPAVPPAN